MSTSTPSWLLALTLAVALISATGRADEPVAESDIGGSAAEQILGEWVQYRNTPNGRYMTIKEHLGDRTVLTIYDPAKVAVYSHQTDYIVDNSDVVPVFRFKNKLILIGPNAGKKDPREDAYLFRVTGDKFYEVRGMLPGDDKSPGMTVWERLNVNPITKPAT